MKNNDLFVADTVGWEQKPGHISVLVFFLVSAHVQNFWVQSFRRKVNYNCKPFQSGCLNRTLNIYEWTSILFSTIYLQLFPLLVGLPPPNLVSNDPPVSALLGSLEEVCPQYHHPEKLMTLEPGTLSLDIQNTDPNKNPTQNILSGGIWMTKMLVGLTIRRGGCKAMVSTQTVRFKIPKHRNQAYMHDI